MKLLLDSHILLALALERLPKVSAVIADCIAQADVEPLASVASLWEIAIKTRLGKLDPGMALEDLPRFFEAIRIAILPITAAHALALVEPLPPTRDPFDRLLLAQGKVENCRLVTLHCATIRLQHDCLESLVSRH